MLRIVCFFLFISLNAKVSNGIFNKTLIRNNTELSEETILDYIYGNETDPKKIDLSLVESKNFGNIMTSALQLGRSHNYRNVYYEVLNGGDKYTPQIIDLMKQSVYATRYRLEDTRPFRKKYRNDPAYQGAVFYGSLMQLRYKLERLYNTMRNFKDTTKFIWFLVIYERIVQTHVDVCFLVEQVFHMKEKLVHLGAEGLDSSEAEGRVPQEPQVMLEEFK